MSHMTARPGEPNFLSVVEEGHTPFVPDRSVKERSAFGRGKADRDIQRDPWEGELMWVIRSVGG